MSKARCKKSFCDKGIHSTKEWRQAIVAKKKELQDSGLIMTQIETHPEYTHLAQCKAEAMNDQNEFMTKQQCSAMFSARAPTRGPARGPARAPPPGRWDARGPAPQGPARAPQPEPWYTRFRWAKEAPTPKAPTPKAPKPAKEAKAKAKEAQGKLPRCKPGTRRHPVSKLCVPSGKAKVKTSVKASPKAKAKTNKLPRCKAGTRRHPVSKTCEVYPFK